MSKKKEKFSFSLSKRKGKEIKFKKQTVNSNACNACN